MGAPSPFDPPFVGTFNHNTSREAAKECSPTACPEPVEGGVSRGKKPNKQTSPSGAKDPLYPHHRHEQNAILGRRDFWEGPDFSRADKPP